MERPAGGGTYLSIPTNAPEFQWLVGVGGMAVCSGNEARRFCVQLCDRSRETGRGRGQPRIATCLLYHDYPATASIELGWKGVGCGGNHTHQGGRAACSSVTNFGLSPRPTSGRTSKTAHRSSSCCSPAKQHVSPPFACARPRLAAPEHAPVALVAGRAASITHAVHRAAKL